MALVALNELKQTVTKILLNSGYTPDESQTILDVLMYAQMRGNNQGIVKLIGAGLPRDPHVQPPQVVRETKLSARVDGGRSVGMVAAKFAVEKAIELARLHGFGIVGTHNTMSSSGAIGYYASLAAQAGFIGFVFAGSGEYVAMHGSYEPLFGTNPLAIGIPTGSGAPLVFDMATSAIARYGIVEAQTANRPIAADVAYDSSGEPTTDPTAALAGAIRTFGGYKGAALSMIVEILTGALVGTSHDDKGHKFDWGNLSMVIDPDLLADRDEFTQRVRNLITRVKAAKKLPGTEEILVPGERGDQILAKIQQTGMIEVEDRLWGALQSVADR